MITPRDVDVLRALARYYVLSRAQIQRLCFPTDVDGRITRRRIAALVHQGLMNRTHLCLVSHAGSASPAYYPARRGCEMLAELCDDEHYYLTPARPPQTHHLYHWLAVSETHIAIDCALALPSADHIECKEWLNEWDIANKDESDPAKRFRLYTLITSTPRLACVPDAAFLLETAGHAMVFYVEQDRATSSARQIAFRKSQGYAALFEQKLHRRHFPLTTLDRFVVLMITTTKNRRDSLCKAVASRPGADLWRFACLDDLEPEHVFLAPVWRKCNGESTSLIKSPVLAEVGV